VSKRFKCILCGICCMKTPVSILPHEDIILRRLAERLGLPYKSRPSYRVFDRIRRSYIALSYTMELVDNKCVFLTRDNLCMIQDIYKPLICRSYPYVPKHVQYNIVWGMKLIFPSVDYGISIECPVIQRDREYIESILARDKRLLREYLRDEFKAAEEMERIRTHLLYLLSELWRRGVVDLVENPGVDAQTLNLYSVLREYYPDLPYQLGIDRVLLRLRS
jgi:Fe-S-cluster containining protein